MINKDIPQEGIPYYHLSDEDKEHEKLCRMRMQEITKQAIIDQQPYVDQLVRIYNRSGVTLRLPTAGIIGEITT